MIKLDVWRDEERWFGFHFGGLRAASLRAVKVWESDILFRVVRSVGTGYLYQPLTEHIPYEPRQGPLF
jgi:hypothetical protein